VFADIISSPLDGSEDSMIDVGQPAPEFALQDQFGRTIALEALRGKRHALLVFYPLDWTPT
jgi:peroxiredoxin